MSAEPLPRPDMDREKALETWKEIAEAIGMSVDTAQDWADQRKHVDPLPVWDYLGHVRAWPSAIREWRMRHLLPLGVAREMRAAKREGRRPVMKKRGR